MKQTLYEISLNMLQGVNWRKFRVLMCVNKTFGATTATTFATNFRTPVVSALPVMWWRSCRRSLAHLVASNVVNKFCFISHFWVVAYSLWPIATVYQQHVAPPLRSATERRKDKGTRTYVDFDKQSHGHRDEVDC